MRLAAPGQAEMMLDAPHALKRGGAETLGHRHRQHVDKGEQGVSGREGR